MRCLRWLGAVGGALALACAAPGSDEDEKDPRGDADADTDADSDADTDADPPDYTWTEVLIDFDELDREIAVDEEYAEWVVFEVEEPYSLYAWEYATYSRSEPFSAYTAESPSGAGVRTDITFRFAEPVRNLEFYTLGDQTDGRLARVDVVTEDGAEDTVPLEGDGSSTSAERCDLRDYENVVSITVRDIEDSYSVNFDDISFEIRGEE